MGVTRPSMDWEKAQIGISCTVTRCTAVAFPCKLWPRRDRRPRRTDSAPLPLLYLSCKLHRTGACHLLPPDGGTKQYVEPDYGEKGRKYHSCPRRSENMELRVEE